MLSTTLERLNFETFNGFKLQRHCNSILVEFWVCAAGLQPKTTCMSGHLGRVIRAVMWKCPRGCWSFSGEPVGLWWTDSLATVCTTSYPVTAGMDSKCFASFTDKAAAMFSVFVFKVKMCCSVHSGQNISYKRSIKKNTLTSDQNPDAPLQLFLPPLHTSIIIFIIT